MELDEKRSAITDKLSKRETDRLSDIQRRNEQKDSSKSIQENVKLFNENFVKEKESIEDDLHKCNLSSKTESATKLDSLAKQIQSMQKYLTESTLFLPAYEVRQAQDIICNLQQQVQSKRDILVPKKKFTFKSKKKQTDVPDSVSASKKDTVDNILRQDVEIELADCKFVDCKEAVLTKGEEIYQKDVCLARLTDCEIRLFGAPSTVHMKNLNNCKVFCGPVSSSIFISDCKNCIFVIACQQLRTHSTEHSKFYLHVTSRAIIEDCSQVFFAPYNLKYDIVDKHFTDACLDETKNNWDDVDDFNWLASDVHSPNWSVMPKEERVQSFRF